mgnify:CR=1 FL=1
MSSRSQSSLRWLVAQSIREDREIRATRKAVAQSRREGTHSRFAEAVGNKRNPIGRYAWSHIFRRTQK